MFTAKRWVPAGALFIIACLQAAMTDSAVADVVVIVHPDNAVTLDEASLKKIYLGRSKAFPDGNKVLLTDVDSDDIRQDFYKTYLHKDRAAIDSHWSRMLFTSNGKPPKVLGSQEAVRQFVASHPQAIGYIDKSMVDKSVRMLDVN